MAPAGDRAEDTSGLAAEVQRLIDAGRSDHGVRVDLVLNGGASRVIGSIQDALVRVCAGGIAAMAAAAGHQRQGMIRIDLWADEAQIEVVADSGSPAFGVERLVDLPASPGLRAGVDAIRASGGAVEYWERFPSGFRLRGTLPLR